MNLSRANRHQSGSSLALVIVITGVSVLVVSGVLQWMSTNATLTQRSNQHFETVAAAEAATEKVVVNMSKDFQLLGEAGVLDNLTSYRALVPTVQDILGLAGGLLGQGSASNAWNNYEFTDGQGREKQTGVERVTPWTYTNLQTKYTGLKGNVSTYRVISNARQLNRANNIVSAVEQKIQIASIPLFQYQFFYNLDLEIHPGANMTFAGRVHSNGSIYSERDLTFAGDVTAARRICNHKHHQDPLSRGTGDFVFRREHDSGVNSLNLPVGTNNSPEALRAILEIPPLLEATNSLIGQQRYYNKADLIIRVNNNSVIATSGAYNGFLITLLYPTISSWLKTNVTFFNKRENKAIQATEIDIAKLNEKYAELTLLLGRQIETIYVADLRSLGWNTQSGVRLINGQTLPANGFSVATPNPLYIKGHYNAPAAHVGTANTSLTVPASLIGDAITILSVGWTDSQSTSNLTSRRASSTTINAAIIAGIVRTGGGYYSGGVENLPRLLEDWSSRTLTFNGSMAVLYESEIATAPWGASDEVYNAPVRNWSWDANFVDPGKMPAGTPELRTLIRGQWATVRPNTVL